MHMVSLILEVLIQSFICISYFSNFDLEVVHVTSLALYMTSRDASLARYQDVMFNH